MPSVARGRGGIEGAGRRRRVGPAAALSLLAHVGALGWLALNAVPHSGSPPQPQPQFEVVLTRPTSESAASPLQSRRAFAAPAAAVAPATRSATPAAPATPVPTPPKPPSPGPPNASTAADGGAPAAGALTGAGGGAGAAGGDLRGLLREALGCTHAQLLDLSPAERARCAERLGLASRTAPRIDPIPADKRAYYDAVATAYAETHFYATPTPSAISRANTPDFRGPLHDWREGVPPGHTANVGCSPLFLLKSYRPRPHSLKLGPCVITPPRGSLTEEADIAEPPTLREREADAAHMRRLDPPKP